MCLCLKDHLNAQERIQHISNLEGDCLEIEEQLLEVEAEAGYAINIANEEINLEEQAMSGSEWFTTALLELESSALWKRWHMFVWFIVLYQQTENERLVKLLMEKHFTVNWKWSRERSWTEAISPYFITNRKNQKCDD
nr:hypothetical protein [Tanacetum cinerariifolium]